MRFVLNEYLSSLKEDKELDVFVIELIKSMRYIPMSRTQRGRQNGVDISAIGTDEDGVRKLFLFVVKQGGFTRKNWDGGNVNDIRPSIEEIFDVYLGTRVQKPYDELKVKIIVCCNGYLDQTVEQNWAGYINQKSSPDVEFDFWGVDKLCSLAEEFQMQEEILSPALAAEFRKALAFIDLPDYNLAHLHSFISRLLPPEEEAKNLTEKKIFKKLRLVNLCMNIIINWCSKSDNIKPAYIASERIILNTWDWISKNSLTENQRVITEYCRILTSWQNLNDQYLNKTYDYFNVQNGLSRGVSDFNEYCLITFEQIGIISSIGLYRLWECVQLVGISDNDIAEMKFKEVEAIANILSNLIRQNSASSNPRYDEHCIEINSALCLLYEMGLFGVAIPWLKDIIERIVLNYKIANFFPLFNSDPKKLSTEQAKDQPSSILTTVLAEWCLIFKRRDLYEYLRAFIVEKMPHINLQLWFPNKKVEQEMFKGFVNDAGNSMISIKLSENYSLMEMHMAEEMVILNEEKEFTYSKLNLMFLPFICSRHFRTYPFPNTWRGYLGTNFCFKN